MAEKVKPEVERLEQIDGPDLTVDDLIHIIQGGKMLCMAYASPETTGDPNGMTFYYPDHSEEIFRRNHTLARNWITLLRMHADDLDKRFPVQ